jgi:hypothetical protein
MIIRWVGQVGCMGKMEETAQKVDTRIVVRKYGGKV